MSKKFWDDCAMLGEKSITLRHWTSRWYPVELVVSYLTDAGFIVVDVPSWEYKSFLTIKKA